ncbi:MAG: acetate/propionate family kinase [Actinomycetota bacterium]|nr:acetate/propionate family kinase [Actinomycetota bacterium]
MDLALLSVRVLVVNAGSSSVKLRVLANDEEVVYSKDLPVTAGGFDEDDVAGALKQIGAVDATGHRVVHGGALFAGPVAVDEQVTKQLYSLTPLAPLHQPLSLAALEAVSRALPDVPAVACFDTAFHHTLSPAAATYAVPAEWRDAYAIRRYGFHGLSHAYAARRAAQMLERPIESMQIVTCHLGAGASLAAVDAGRSVDTTMGFTPLEGLVMATRSGTVDPGLLLWLQQSAGLSLEEVAEALEHRSGLKALAGTADMRAVLAAADKGERGARLGVDVYLHRLCAGVGAMAASMGGLDALVFTGGVGENAPFIREQAAQRLGFLGVGIDKDANERTTQDAVIGAAAAAVRTLVVNSREDIEIAREVRRVLAGSRA